MAEDGIEAFYVLPRNKREETETRAPILISVAGEVLKVQFAEALQNRPATGVAGGLVVPQNLGDE
jgi:hypothetical protein